MLGPRTASLFSVNTFHPEAQPFVVLTALIGVFFVAAMVRLWLLRRVEDRLLKNKDALERQVLAQQKELMQVRSDANSWRAEMQRQFDLFRHMASEQLKVEETRFDNLLKQSRERERDLQAELDIARRMGAELPSAKARLMQLEGLLGIDTGESLGEGSAPAAENGDLAPLPDLNGAWQATDVFTASEPAESPDGISAAGEAGFGEVQALRQENTALKQALTAERLRSRIRERSLNGLKTRKNRN
ncbi:MAG: hypothetical protein CJBNEKGG_03751 [Prosthecobacter sp.]|nr:hypothetical protein [Prosthecobacter sp.]